MKNKKNEKDYQPLLAIDPTVRGFGYVVFEGPKNPIDWGVACMRICKNTRILSRIESLIEMYQPETIVIEEAVQSLRGARVKKLLADIEKLAVKSNVQVVKYSRNQVLEVFGEFGKSNKFEVAQIIADWLPVLESRLPAKRKCYQSESDQYGLFDAAALGLTHMYLND